MRVAAKPAFAHRHLNPYQSLLYTRLQRLGVTVEEFRPFRLLFRRYDILHLHWPDLFLKRSAVMASIVRALGLFVLVAWAKARGARLVWTIHNLRGHEPFVGWFEHLFWFVFIRLVDGAISLSETGKTLAVDLYPRLDGRPHAVIPHGHYRGVYPDSASRDEARDRLGLGRGVGVACFVGLIRPYKNVPGLIRAFRDVSAPETALVIAGQPAPPDQANALAGEIRRLSAGDERIKLSLDFVDDADIQVYLRAADLVVLPYHEILNSGSALLALSFDCPILLPDNGAQGELQRLVGADWVRLYECEITAELLRQALDWATGTPRRDRAPLERLDWDDLARQTRDAYVETCSASRSEPA